MKKIIIFYVVINCIKSSTEVEETLNNYFCDKETSNNKKTNKNLVSYLLKNVKHYEPTISLYTPDFSKMKTYLLRYYNVNENRNNSKSILTFKCLKNNDENELKKNEDFFNNNLEMLIKEINKKNYEGLCELVNIKLEGINFRYLHYNKNLNLSKNKRKKKNKNDDKNKFDMQIKLFLEIFTSEKNVNNNLLLYICTKYIKWYPLFLWVLSECGCSNNDFSKFFDFINFQLALQNINDVIITTCDTIKNCKNVRSQKNKIKKLCKALLDLILSPSEQFFENTNKDLMVRLKKIEKSKNACFVSDSSLLYCLIKCLLIANYDAGGLHFIDQKKAILCKMGNLISKITLKNDDSPPPNHNLIQYKIFHINTQKPIVSENYMRNVEILKKCLFTYLVNQCNLNIKFSEILIESYFSSIHLYMLK